MNNWSSVQIRLSALLPSFEPSAVELRVRDRLPLPKAQREQLGTRLCVAAVEDAHVVRIGGQVDTGRPLAKLGVGECCHESPSSRVSRPSSSIALRSLWFTSRMSAGVRFSGYRTAVIPRRSVGSLAPFEWRMNVRRMPSAPPNKPASKTTLSRGEA